MKELIEDLKSGQLKHVYLLFGTEDYLKLQYRDKLVSALIPGDPGMNLTVFEGDGLTEGAVIDQAETLPFFAEKRVIRLDHTGLFKKTAELLPDYMKSLPDYLYLVFTENEVDKRSRLYKAVQAAGRCVEFGEQSADVLAGWIAKMLGKENLRIRRSALTHLIERTGTDMNRILRETDKLIHYCAGREEVTAEDIDAVTSVTLEDRIFDMIQAVTELRRRDAMELYADLMALKEPPGKILALMSMQYNRLLMVKELSGSGLSEGAIAKKAGMPPFAVRKSLPLVRRYTKEQLTAALADCVRTEEAFKSGALRDRTAVELLLITLSGAQKSGAQKGGAHKGGAHKDGAPKR